MTLPAFDRIDAQTRRQLASRRARLAREQPDTLFILPAAPTHPRRGSTNYPYRSDSDLLYLSGFGEPQALLALSTRGGRSEASLFVRERDPTWELWNGPIAGPRRAAGATGIADARPISALERALPELLDGVERVAYRIGRDEGRDRAVLSALGARAAATARSGRGMLSLVDPTPLVGELRLFKEPTELDALRRAATASAAAHAAVMGTARPGDSELTLAGRFEAELRAAGCEQLSFSTLVAAGARATCLHAAPSPRAIVDGELVLVDGGGVLDGYAADISRTFPAGPRFADGAQRDAYAAVLDAQQRAIDAVRPGATLDDVHAAAAVALDSSLRRLGFESGDDERATGDAPSALVARYFPHRTSHWIGIDAHDPGLLCPDGAPRPLEPGMVFSVEPGLYVPADDQRAPAALRGLGIRVEDMVCVRDNGTAEVLGAPAPKAIADIEPLRAT